MSLYNRRQMFDFKMQGISTADTACDKGLKSWILETCERLTQTQLGEKMLRIIMNRYKTNQEKAHAVFVLRDIQPLYHSRPLTGLPSSLLHKYLMTLAAHVIITLAAPLTSDMTFSRPKAICLFQLTSHFNLCTVDIY